MSLAEIKNPSNWEVCERSWLSATKPYFLKGNFRHGPFVGRAWLNLDQPTYFHSHTTTPHATYPHSFLFLQPYMHVGKLFDSFN